MGETHSVTMNSEPPTGPTAPNAQPVQATVETSGSVSIPTDQTPPVEPQEQPAPEAGPRRGL